MNDLGGMAVAVKYRGVRVRERGRIGEDGFATYGFGRFPSRVSLGVPERGQSRTEKRGLVVYLPDAPYPRRRILLAALDNYTHGTPTLAAVARIPNQTRAVTGAPKNPARNALPLLRAVAGLLLETLDRSGQASAERVWGVSGGGGGGGLGLTFGGRQLDHFPPFFFYTPHSSCAPLLPVSSRSAVVVVVVVRTHRQSSDSLGCRVTSPLSCCRYSSIHNIIVSSCRQETRSFARRFRGLTKRNWKNRPSPSLRSREPSHRPHREPSHRLRRDPSHSLGRNPSRNPGPNPWRRRLR